MRNTAVFETPCDLSEPSFEEAIFRLGAIGDTPHTTLICGDSNWATAERIRQHYKCQVWNVPEELLQTRWTWGISYLGRTQWTKGIE